MAALSVRIHGPIARADLDLLAARCRGYFAAHPGRCVECDVSGVPGDAVTVDALARLQRAAQEHGCRVLLTNASQELRALLDLMGLADVLPSA